MKKTLLSLSIVLGASSTFAETGEKCSAYIDRKAGTTTSYNGTNVGILTADQAIKTGIAAAIETTESLSPVGKIFPFVSIALRGFAAETSEGPDEDLVGCLEEFDGRIETLEYYTLAQQASDALRAVQDDVIQAEIYEQNNRYAHKDAYDDYDEISNDIAGTLSYFLDDDDEPTGSKWRAIKNDTLLMLLTAELSAFAHNLEFNAYCASEYGYRWSDTALDLLNYNDVSGNFALMDYNAQYAATNAGYDDFDLFDYDNYRANCELSRDIYSRFRSLRTSSGTLIGDALSDLGLTVSINSTTNKLEVSVNTSASKLLDYRLSVIGSCSTGEKGPIISDGYLGYRVWASAEDFGPSESTKFYRSSMGGTGDKNSRKSTMLSFCNSWRSGRISAATTEVEEVLYGIKDTLESLVIYDYIRPSNELAGREVSFDTYHYGELSDSLLSNYVLKPVFTLNSDGDIIDKYNHYQFSLWGANNYLKTRPGEGVFTRNNGSGTDSHWKVAEKWPGLGVKLENVYSGECLTKTNNAFNTESCDDASYRWLSEGSSGSAQYALIYLHAQTHTGKCVGIGDETISQYGNSNKIVAEDCNNGDANQRIILDSQNRLLVNNKCVDIPRSEAFPGQILIAYACHSNQNQQWIMNDDGTIQTQLSSSTGGSDLCIQADDSTDNIVEITLAACDSTEPKQKLIRRTVKTSTVHVGAVNAKIEHIVNGSCIGGCGTTFDVKSGLKSSTMSLVKTSDGQYLYQESGTTPYFDKPETSFIKDIEEAACAASAVATQSSTDQCFESRLHSWYLDDSNGDGVYALRSFDAETCLTLSGSTMGSESCDVDSEVWFFH